MCTHSMAQKYCAKADANLYCLTCKLLWGNKIKKWQEKHHDSFFRRQYHPRSPHQDTWQLGSGSWIPLRNWAREHAVFQHLHQKRNILSKHQVEPSFWSNYPYHHQDYGYPHHQNIQTMWRLLSGRKFSSFLRNSTWAKAANTAMLLKIISSLLIYI